MNIRYLFFMLLIVIMAASCTKDEDIKAIDAKKTDSIRSINFPLTRANMLAVSGTLTIKVKDSIYTFDAKSDSIAIVNIYLEDQKYFGITAINKAHTMSFGISSPGYAASNSTKRVAGGQFLFNNGNIKNDEYTLSQNDSIPEPGKIILTQYTRDSVLAKGTFFTYLSKDIKSTSPFYKVEGSFNLKIK
jgi:hypothetical protein